MAYSVVKRQQLSGAEPSLGQGGVSLLEMLLVLVSLAALLALTQPLLGSLAGAWRQLDQQTEQLAQLQNAHGHLRAWLAQATPGSVRISADGVHLEWLPASLGFGALGLPAQVAGGLPPLRTFPVGQTDQPQPADGSLGGRLAIPANAATLYQDLAAELDVGTVTASSNALSMTLNGNVLESVRLHQFQPLTGPLLFYLVGAPLGLRCEQGGLYLQQGYAASANLPDIGAGQLVPLISAELSDCQFSLEASADGRPAQVGLKLLLAETAVQLQWQLPARDVQADLP